MNVRQAAYALRVVRRSTGAAGIVYRRELTEKREERLTRVGALSPLAFSAGAGLVRAAVRATAGPKAALSEGPFHPLDWEWGPRVACYCLVARGLRNAERLHRAAENLRHADGAEAAWWFGLMGNSQSKRATRAFRILVEATK